MAVREQQPNGELLDTAAKRLREKQAVALREQQHNGELLYAVAKRPEGGHSRALADGGGAETGNNIQGGGILDTRRSFMGRGGKLHSAVHGAGRETCQRTSESANNHSYWGSPAHRPAG
jgi:hypothetical protein